jgi:hypothetical protein
MRPTTDNPLKPPRRLGRLAAALPLAAALALGAAGAAQADQAAPVPAPAAGPHTIQTMKVTSSVLSGGQDRKYWGLYAQVKVKTTWGIGYWGKEVYFKYNGFVVGAKTNASGKARIEIRNLPQVMDGCTEVTAFLDKPNGTQVMTANGTPNLVICPHSN